jgi:murein DD-endopeptidase MepM/ murein hydrolase activator NlpD
MKFNVWHFFTAGLFVLFVVWGFSFYSKSKTEVAIGSLVRSESPAIPAYSSSPSLEYEAVRMRPGSSLGNMLKKHNVEAREAYDIITALRRVFNPRKIKAGDILKIAKDENDAILELRYKPSTELTIIIKRDSLNQFIALADTLPVYTETGFVYGTLETTLYDAVLGAGESPELIMNFTDIFQWDIDFFTEPRVGDRFAILFEKQFVVDRLTHLPSFLRYGEVIAGAYLKKDSSYIAFNFPDDKGYPRFYDVHGNSFQKTFLKSPLNYRRIASYFSRARFHPILKIVRPHTGIDYSAARGTPVVAAADGRIVHIGWLGGYGKCIKISHKNGTYITLYGHLSRYATGLKPGSQVVQNQVIGYVGSTGLATGPHLHYTMYLNGKPINPLKIRPSSGKSIAPDLMPQFSEMRDIFLARLGLTPENELDFSQQVIAIAR